MVESGGPANQAGVLYQNTIAALYLGRMIDLKSRPIQDQVLSVRVESPTDVDDILVEMGDKKRRFIQAKRTLQTSGKAWTLLWRSFERQILSFDFSTGDTLVLVLGEVSLLGGDLRECCSRAKTSLNLNELNERLNKEQLVILEKIIEEFSEKENPSEFVLRILKNTVVEIIPSDSVERDYSPTWIPDNIGNTNNLLSLLRDISAQGSCVRAQFNAVEVRKYLRDIYNVNIAEPEFWGTKLYRETIKLNANIDVPGTQIVRKIDEDFIWPIARNYDLSRVPDFEDETINLISNSSEDQIDLSNFPSIDLQHLIVIAGPGFGKCVLLQAITLKVSQKELLPVHISIPDLSEDDDEISIYLTKKINIIFEVNIDWTAAANTGLLVLLFDGLDEISSDRRTMVLRKIKNFASRHPAVPWILTVRDAAALNAPISARLVELQLLNDDDIVKYVKYYQPNQKELPEKLIQSFSNMPEMKRLIKIPLFLTLVLSTIDNFDDLPIRRTQLIERYLELILHPELFKQVQIDSVDPIFLRHIAEQIAYEALEKEEIGASGKELISVIKFNSVPGTNIQLVIERLGKCGVLRKSSNGRYCFPFPTVQEYLASCYLLTEKHSELEKRLVLVGKRPWAQTIQFALEEYRGPLDLITKFLDIEDDIFATNLRLIARCVANGMRVDSNIREKVAIQLAHVIPTLSSRFIERTSDIIYDTFCDPLIPEIRELLFKKWFFNNGGAKILAKINDPCLSKDVLKFFLNQNIEYFLNLREFQEPVSKLGNEALELYRDVSKNVQKTVKERNAISALISHMDTKFLSKSNLKTISEDELIPISVRLAAYSHFLERFDTGALNLALLAIQDDDYLNCISGFNVLGKFPTRNEIFFEILTSHKYDLGKRLSFINYICENIPHSERSILFYTWGKDARLHVEISYRLLVFSARFGSVEALEKLIDGFGDLPINIVRASLSILGHHNSRILVTRSIEKIIQRKLSASDKHDLARNASLGMVYKFEMEHFESGALISIPPHCGISDFRQLLEEWSMYEKDFTTLQSLEMTEYLITLGSSIAINELEKKLKNYFDSKEIDWKNYVNASHVGNAIRTLQNHRILLPLDYLSQIIEKCSYNGSSQAVTMMGLHGTKKAFDLLIYHYSSIEETHLKDTILDSLESISSRIGVKVVIRNNEMTTVEIS